MIRAGRRPESGDDLGHAAAEMLVVVWFQRPDVLTPRTDPSIVESRDAETGRRPVMTITTKETVI